jgi:transitional endoplasmic reticulum ATPase
VDERSRIGWIKSLNLPPETSGQEIEDLLARVMLDEVRLQRYRMAEEFKRRIVVMPPADKMSMITLKKREGAPHVRGTFGKERNEMKKVSEKMRTKTGEERLEEQMEEFKSVGIESTGTKIVLPEGMDLTTGIEWLKRHRQELEEEVSVNEVIKAYPLDAALALAKVLHRRFGWAHMKAVDMGFFGKRPPVMVGVPTSVDTSEQVPWGRMEIPGIDGYIETNIGRGDGGMPVMRLGGEVRRKNEKEVHEIAAQVRKVVREESIYRGKAIRIDFPDDGDDFDPSQAPKFLDISQVRPEELVFSADLDRLIRTALFVPIEKTEMCRRHQIPLKRGILLEGPFGTGKTLTAWVTARKAQESGWTFLYLSSVADLSKAVQFAKQYAPCVIFAEDIDSIGKDRTSMVNRLLNVIDGVESKSSELIVVLTTNAVTEINQALLRPGRLDAVVSVRAPDAGAVERLIRLYSRDLLRKDEDLS